MKLTNPPAWPEGKIGAVYDPVVKTTVIAPAEFIGTIMELCQSRRGELGGMDYLSPERVELRYTMPLTRLRDHLAGYDPGPAPRFAWPARLEASGTEIGPVALRRADLSGKRDPFANILDFIDLDRYTILPNTAGCFTADDAVRTARLGREILSGLNNPGASWIKLEVLGDKRTLLPDPVATPDATRQLVAGGVEGPG